jgi:hypothetical protein
MAGKELPANPKESKSERAARVLRNLNALGAVALFGVGAVAPAGAVAFNTLAAVDAAQAGGFEWLRRHRKKKRLKKT